MVGEGRNDDGGVGFVATVEVGSWDLVEKRMTRAEEVSMLMR